MESSRASPYRRDPTGTYRRDYSKRGWELLSAQRYRYHIFGTRIHHQYSNRQLFTRCKYHYHAGGTQPQSIQRKNTGSQDRWDGSCLFSDQYLTKSEILQMYINIPYLGQHRSYAICGFAMAAQHYYNKDIRDIELHEAATSLVFCQHPGLYRPDKYPEASRKNNRVLRKMSQLKL